MTDAPIEGVPRWAQPSLLKWLAPILNAVESQDAREPLTTLQLHSTEFLLLAERRLHLQLDWNHGGRATLESLGKFMDTPDTFLHVLELAIEHVDLGYSFQQQDMALADLDRILTESGMMWRVDVQDIPTGDTWHGHPGFQRVRTLQRRTTPEATDAVQALSRNSPNLAQHMTNAWNYAFGRNPDPRSAYREAILAVEAAAIPIIVPNNAKATLGSVIGEMRAAPQKWQLVLSRSSTQQPVPIEVIASMAELLWVNQTDRHGPVQQPVIQEQAEMAVHLALTLVQAFTRSITAVSDHHTTRLDSSAASDP
jgi:hypothetical protein